MGYCSEADVEMELQMEFDNESTPNSDEVTVFIAIADKYVDLATGRSWSEIVIGNTDYEYHDADGSSVYILKNRPITDVTKVEENTAGVGAAVNWVERTEGYDKDFLVYETRAKVKFIDNIPATGYKNLRFQYKHGCTTTPDNIRILSAIFTALMCVYAITAPEILDNLRGYSILDLKVFKHGTSPRIQALWNKFNYFLKLSGVKRQAFIAA